MFDNNPMPNMGGLALSFVGMSFGDILGIASAVAAIIHACFLVAQLIVRFVLAIKAHKKGKLTDADLTATIEDIVKDSGEILNVRGDNDGNSIP